MTEYTKVQDILIALTDITGYDHTETSNEAFALAKKEIESLIKEAKQDIITLIENEETDYPVRESDEFDEGGRMLKQALLGKLKQLK